MAPQSPPVDYDPGRPPLPTDEAILQELVKPEHAQGVRINVLLQALNCCYEGLREGLRRLVKTGAARVFHDEGKFPLYQHPSHPALALGSDGLVARAAQ